MKIQILSKVINIFLLLIGFIVLFGSVEVLFLGKIYPYALLTALSILSLSNFLVLKICSTESNRAIVSFLTIVAITNASLLCAFSFFTDLLKYFWNYSFGISFLFTAFYVIQIFQKEKSVLTKSGTYITLITLLCFEFILIFKLSNHWIFEIMTVLLGLVTLLMITFLVVGRKTQTS